MNNAGVAGGDKYRVTDGHEPDEHRKSISAEGVGESSIVSGPMGGSAGPTLSRVENAFYNSWN